MGSILIKISSLAARTYHLHVDAVFVLNALTETSKYKKKAH